MVFERYAEIGRVAYISFGSYAGELVVIVDVIDQNGALVDGPCTGQPMGFERLQLTDYVIKVPHSARRRFVRKAWEEAQIDGKWAESSWAKKMEARESRANMLDIHRLEVMKAKREMKEELKHEVRKLQEEAENNRTF